MSEDSSVRISATISSDIAKSLESFSKSSGLKKSSIINASLKQFFDLNSNNLINSTNKKIDKIILLGIESFNSKKIPFFHVGEEVPNTPRLGIVKDIVVSDDGSYFYIALTGGDSMGEFGPVSTFTVSTSDYVAADFK